MSKIPPIVSVSIDAASPAPDVWGKILAFVDTARTVSADGLTLKEFAQLTLELVKLSVRSAALLNIDNADKREIVLDGVAQLFDALADGLVPMYLKPVWFVLKSSVRSALLAAAAGAIDYVLTN